MRLSDTAVCGGPDIASTGADGDDANIALDDCLTRTLSPLGTDTDLFQVRAALSGSVDVTVDPSAGVDVALDVYDQVGGLVGRLNSQGPGMREGVALSPWTPDMVLYVLVKDAGSSVSNTYEICVQQTP